MGIGDGVLWGNTLRAWAAALGLTLGLMAAAWVVLRIVLWRLAAAAKRLGDGMAGLVIDVLTRTRFLLLLVLALYAGSQLLALPERAAQWAGTLALMAFLIQAAIWGDAVITYWLTRYQRQAADVDGGRVTTARAISFVIRLALISILVLLALDNIPGVEVTTLIASLGVGGIAVALAVQSILADVFASLSIALDRPFVIGDFIVVDQFRGTVEHVGLKTTRVRSVSGEQLVFSNNDLLNSRIANMKRMTERRVLFTLGVTYQTPHAKLARVPGLIKEILDAQPHVRFDRAHFKAYGDFALIFEAVYFVLDPDFGLYMDTQQAVNLALYQRFEQEGIEFAYPTQTVFVNQAAGGAPPAPQKRRAKAG